MHERFSAWLGKGFAATQRRGPQGVERLGFKSIGSKRATAIVVLRQIKLRALTCCRLLVNPA